MGKNNHLRGVGVALVTPFNTVGDIDFPALERLIEYNIAGGIDYLVVLGTTGESATMTATEKAEVLRFVIRKNQGRKPIVYGVGGNNTAEVLRNIATLDTEGIDALLSVSPYYNKPSQNGIYAHYKAIAEASPLPVILYNVPGRTGSNISAATTLRLAHDFSNIIGIKEASGNLFQSAYILRDRPENFLVISGEDNLATSIIGLGGDGVISVAAGAFPKTFCDMIHAALDNKPEIARVHYMKLLEATDALFEDGNPAGVKAALHCKGLIENKLRLPLVPVCEKVYAKIQTQIEKYSL